MIYLLMLCVLIKLQAPVLMWIIFVLCAGTDLLMVSRK